MTQVSEPGSQIGFSVPQSAEPTQPTQVFELVSHFSPPLQSVSFVQATQVLFVEQTGASAGQSLASSGVQRTHAPESAQTALFGSFFLHSASFLQAPQVLAVQIGVTPAQSLLVMQATQVFVAALQAD